MSAGRAEDVGAGAVADVGVPSRAGSVTLPGTYGSQAQSGREGKQAMEGRYRVADVDQRSGTLHLVGAGGKRFRVQLGAKSLARFVLGMTVTLKKSGEAGLVLAATTPGNTVPSRRRTEAPVDPGGRRDRRRGRRVAFGGSATVTVGSRTIQCEACDISSRGISLRLPKFEQLEDPVELAFKLPSSHRLLQATGSVARVGRLASEAVWGLGFSAIGEDARSALEAFVAAAGTSATAEDRSSKLDRSLASLYETAVAGLDSEKKTR